MFEPEQCRSMQDVRSGLDALDREITDLLAKRFRYIDAAARIKQSRDQIRDEERIALVIEQVRSRAAAAGAPAMFIAKAYKNLIEASIEYELEKFDARRE
jgi:isochorismate pyruvate lyase